jgi:hypothetical protein
MPLRGRPRTPSRFANLKVGIPSLDLIDAIDDYAEMLDRRSARPAAIKF